MAAGNTLLYSRTRGLSKSRKKRHLPLTRKDWEDAFESSTGRLIDTDKIIRKIRHGGIESSIRAEVWPFLLSFYDWESTEEEREAERSVRREEYDDLKRRCMSLRERKAWGECKGSLVSRAVYVDASPTGSLLSLAGSYVTGTGCLASVESVSPFSSDNSSPTEQGNTNWQGLSDGKLSVEFNNWQRIIRLDAIRMNAEWVPYSPSQANVTEKAASQLAADVGLKQDEHLEPCLQHHAARLVAILEAYALYDPEIGYCQGMSDLLSPFVALLDEDYQAFWCFASFMYSARENFRLDEEGIHRQLQMISKILKLSDPRLYKHLLKIEAADCFFIYRMVVVLMKRELSFEQIITFWEVLWADKTAARLGKVKVSCRKGRRKAPPCDDLLLYVIAATIHLKRRFILDKCRSMDDILRECNGMSGNLDVWPLLDYARLLIASLHRKFLV